MFTKNEHRARFLFFRQHRQQLRENSQTPAQNAIHISNGNPVIGKRDAGVGSAFLPVDHLSAIKHTPAAMDNQPVFRQVVGEPEAGTGLDLQFLPVYFRSQFGILTVPISSHCRWWVHPSEISTVSPSRSRSIAATPSTAWARKPLYRAIRIEKEVSGISFGVTASTSLKAWLSVTTRAGGSFSFPRVSASSVSRGDQRRRPPIQGCPDCLLLRKNQPPLRRRGIDRDDQDDRFPRLNDVAHQPTDGPSVRTRPPIRFFSSSIPSPVLALTATAPSGSSAGVEISCLLNAIR